MSKRLSKFIAPFDYFGRSLIVLSATTGIISIASLATANGALVGIITASFSLAFSISTGIIKKLLKTRNKKRKDNKVVMLGRSKLNSIESKISEALINNEISHKDFRELKESIRMMNTQRSDSEKINLIEEGKKIGVNEVIKHNRVISNSLKP